MKITEKKLLLPIVGVFVIIGSDAYLGKKGNRTGRLYNPLVSVVAFANDPCTGAATR